MSLKPPPTSGRVVDSTHTSIAKPASSFLKMGGDSIRTGGAGITERHGSTVMNKTSNFSKMVSGRGAANQSMRGHGPGHGKGDKNSGSGRRSRKKKKDDSARVIVDGRDLTPQSLVANNAIGGMGLAFIQSAIPMPTSQFDPDSSTTGGGGGVIGMDSSHLVHHSHSTVSASESEHVFVGAHDERDWAGAARHALAFEYAVDTTTSVVPKVKEWTDKELREKHTIKIEETDTITLFHLPSIKIWTEDEVEASAADKMNKNYLQCLEKHKEKDKYIQRSIQTLNPSQREKEVQVAPPPTRSAGVDVTTWDIFDVATKLEQLITAVGPNGQIPHIQHESDLLARVMAGGSTSSSSQTRAEEEEEEMLASRHSGGDLRHGNVGGMSGIMSSHGGLAGIHTDTSNTPSTHSAAQSFQNLSLASASASGIGIGGNVSGMTGTGTGTSSSHLTGAGGMTGSMMDVSKFGRMNAGAINAHMHPTQSPQLAAQSALVEKLLSKPTVARKLRALEQAVLQNSLHSAQMLYRNHPEASEEEWAAMRNTADGPKYDLGTTGTNGMMDDGSTVATGASTSTFTGSSHAPASSVSPSSQSPAGIGASLIPLWSFSCPLTRGMNVSCMTWNRQNFDLLAAGYGLLEFGHNARDELGHPIHGIQVPRIPKKEDGSGSSSRSPTTPTTGGLILFWSLKNPAYPAKVFYTKSSVTSIDFCEEHPHLLAAGMYDGSVAVYDIRDHSSKPALESSHQLGKHSEPVWGVKFVAKELNKRSQQLTSISTDGSVKQWSMKKGLVPHELMQLKRMPNRAQLQGTTMEGLSREASGMCFDFPINDGTQYFAGTEDGLIHKCSVSYNEQTLDNFYGHTGPVYRVRCSPFLPDAFLSCSADWSAMLWSQRISSKPVLKFASGGQDYITDIVWSQNQACLFGLVSREGRIEIWDLEVSPLDPIIKYQISDSPSSSSSSSSSTESDAAAIATNGTGTSTGLDHTLSSLSNGVIDPSKLLSPSNGSSTSPASATLLTPPSKKRLLTCMAFSSNAPVVLVGTSDGAIEVFRLEGTVLTSTPHSSPDATYDSHLHSHVTYGQELNAATVMQVPRDRERDSNEPRAAGANGDMHEDQARSALEQHQLAMVKFKEQARKLEAIMEQHNDTKNKLMSSVDSSTTSNAVPSTN